MNITIDDIRSEAKVIRDQCLLASERHFAAEGPWYYLNYWLGIPAAVLAAVAGAAGLSQITNSGLLAGAISLLVAVLTSLLTFLNPTKKADTFHNFAKEYESLYHDIGIFYRIFTKQENVDVDELLNQLQAFSKKFNDLNRQSPAISLRAQKLAGEKLASGSGEVVQEQIDENQDKR